MRKVVGAIVLIVIGVVFSMVGDVLLKKSGVSNLGMLAAGVVLYGCGAIPVAIAFKSIQFGSVFLAWEAVSVITALLVAQWLFKEPLTVFKILSLGFALIALCLSYR